MKIAGLLPAVLIGLATMAHSQEITWPQELSGDEGGVVLIYQPQVEVFRGNNIEARAAVSVKTAASGNTPVFGAIWIESKIDTNRDTRTAIIRDIKISDVRFADASDDQKDALAKFIEAKVEGSTLTISVDQLLADLDAEGAGITQADLRHEPPKIMLSTKPAILVSIDGDPVLQEIDGSNYDRVVNSAFLIVKDGRTHYLYVGSNTWYQAAEIPGPWIIATAVPADIKSFVEPADGDMEGPGKMDVIIATEPT